MKNKGFSLVELIIVIAIMAILAAAIAPALIRYIDKSRKADDVTAGGTINSAVSAALANEDAYDELQNWSNTIVAVVSKGGMTASGSAFKDELEANLDQKVAPKYKKEDQAAFYVYADANHKISVVIGKASGATPATDYVNWGMQPSIGKSYK